MTKRITPKKVIDVPLEEKYLILQENFKEYLESLNMPTILEFKVVPLAALEITIDDERLIKPIEYLTDKFSEDIPLQTTTVIRVKKEEL